MSQEFDPNRLPLVPFERSASPSGDRSRVLPSAAAVLLHELIESVHSDNSYQRVGFRHLVDGGAKWSGRELQLREGGPNYIFKGIIGFNHKTVAFLIEEPNALGMQSAERVLKFGSNPAEIEANLHLAKSPVFVGPPGEQRHLLPPMSDYTYFRNMPLMVFEKVNGLPFGKFINMRADGISHFQRFSAAILQAFDGIQALFQRGIGYVDRFSPNAFVHEMPCGPLLTMIDLDLSKLVRDESTREHVQQRILQAFCSDVAWLQYDAIGLSGMQPFFRQFQLAADSLDPTTSDEDLITPSPEEVRTYLQGFHELFGSCSELPQAFSRLPELRLGRLPFSSDW